VQPRWGWGGDSVPANCRCHGPPPRPHRLRARRNRRRRLPILDGSQLPRPPRPRPQPPGPTRAGSLRKRADAREMTSNPPPTAQAGGATVPLPLLNTIPRSPQHGRDARATPPSRPNRASRVRETHHLLYHSNCTPASSRTSASPEQSMVRFTHPTLLGLNKISDKTCSRHICVNAQMESWVNSHPGRQLRPCHALACVLSRFRISLRAGGTCVSPVRSLSSPASGNLADGRPIGNTLGHPHGMEGRTQPGASCRAPGRPHCFRSGLPPVTSCPTRHSSLPTSPSLLPSHSWTRSLLPPPRFRHR